MEPSPTAPARPLSRRTVVLAAGGTALTLGVAGCTSYGSGTAAAPETAAPPTAEAAGRGAALAKTSEIPVGGGRIFPDAKAVVVQPTAGDFRAYSAVCTHQGCLVSEVATTINCPCHGSSFALADGAVTAGPAPAPLPALQVAVAGEDLIVTG